MNIGIVGITENSFVRGVERYTLELIRKMALIYKDEKFFLFRGKWQSYYDELKNYENINLITIDNLKNSKINRHFFIAFKFFNYIKNKSINLDIIHYNNTLPILTKPPIPNVITIHDIAEFFVPEKYSFFQRIYRKNILKISTRNADFIITVSNFSRQNIIKYLYVPENKIKSIYLGVDHFLKDSNADYTKYENIKKIGDYILYWSVIEHSKGVIETIRTFELIKKADNYKNLKLIIIGKPGNAYKDVKNIIKNNKDIIYLGFVDDNTLKSYIKNAKIVLFPSRYEGFGFPALESYLLNPNVITSKTTSLGEITKGFALQVDPADINDICEKTKQLLKQQNSNKVKKEELLRKFSWKNTAMQTYNIYTNLVYKRYRQEEIK